MQRRTTMKKRHPGARRLIAMVEVSLCGGLVLLAPLGCGRKQRDRAGAAAKPEPAAATATLPAGLFLAEAPPGVKPIKEWKAESSEGDEIVVRAVVGGRKAPIVSGRALWTAVDVALYNKCKRCGAACPTPWDYCCGAPEQIVPHMITVQIVDEQGRPLAVDLTSSGKIKPMATLVIRGVVAQRPNPETLVMNASGVFVEPPAAEQ